MTPIPPSSADAALPLAVLPETAPKRWHRLAAGLRAAFGRLHHAIPRAAAFAPVYAAAITLAVAIHLVLAERGMTPRFAAIVIVYALGSLVGGFTAWLAAAFVAGRRPPSARFAAMAACLGVGTVAFTAFLFFLQYRTYYVQWHDYSHLKYWIINQLFTGGSAVYIFAVSGVRLMLPFGLVPLLVGSWAFTRWGRG